MGFGRVWKTWRVYKINLNTMVLFVIINPAMIKNGWFCVSVVEFIIIVLFLLRLKRLKMSQQSKFEKKYFIQV